VQVLHPALPGCPGHEFWKRDFLGASGLFAVILKPYPKAALAEMLDYMKLFGMGFSWGGYESLMVPYDLSDVRTVTRYEWSHGYRVLRLYAGLEDPDDLIADLEAGFVRLNAV
jgi:cystathionine beta-lyase